MALIAPNLSVRATGDAEAKASVKRLFTDQVSAWTCRSWPWDRPVAPSSISIRCWSETPVTVFWILRACHQQPRLQTIKSAKVFPKNVEIAFEIVGGRGQFANDPLFVQRSARRRASGFKPREADERVGYFTTSYSRDLEQVRRTTKHASDYINRWKLEKRDPKLKLSPPKEPIRFYVEHTAPVRYRRWIKAGGRLLE